MNRRRAFGLISHITPLVLPVFLVLFYAPFIAALLRTQGWSKLAAFGGGFATPTFLIGLGIAVAHVIPPRFDKLSNALLLVVLGFPLVGMFGIGIWAFINAIRHLLP